MDRRDQSLARRTKSRDTRLTPCCSVARARCDMEERAAAERANDAKDEFLAMLAHELRNPLAPIRNALALLSAPGVDEAASREAREVMGRQIDHLVRLVDDLLDVSGTAEDLGKTPGKDAKAEKATYPALYGLEEAKNLARETHRKCVAALGEIDKPTTLLRQIADFILERKK